MYAQRRGGEMEEIMNILLFSEAAWDDKNAFGNTVSNFFAGEIWKEDNFSDFYVRSKNPDNKVEVEYYNLSAIDIIKGITKFKIKGRRFSSDSILTDSVFSNEQSESENKSIKLIHKRKNHFVYFVHECIWMSRLWLNGSFKQFINDVKPDILFAFAQSPFILWPLISYLKKNTGCKVVLLVADDTYNIYDTYPFYRRFYSKKLLEKCLLNSDKLYAISDEMTELYSNHFNREISTLYKGCDLSLPPIKHLNSPLKIVYAGNLYYGRDNILSRVAKAIEEINKDTCRVKLEIYTGANITNEIEKKLNIPNCSEIMGLRSYDKIKKILHEADIVLHVESFEEETINTVRYSLSTKIIDCLQSGSQVLGIGPNGIASINYLKKVDGAVVIDNEKDIMKKLEELISDSQMLERINKTRKYALSHHEINNIQNNLRNDLKSLL